MTGARACDDLRALPLRARKRERARRHVEAVALRLFAEQGYDATTVQQIADVAEVGPRSFFRYFTSKEDLLLGDVRRLAATLPERLRVEGETRPEDTVGSVVHALGFLTSAAEEDHELLTLRYDIVCTTPSVAGAVLSVLAAGEQDVASFVARREGCDADRDLYPWLVASVLLNAHHTAVTRWSAAGAHGDPRSLVDLALQQAAAGLREHLVPHHEPPAG